MTTLAHLSGHPATTAHGGRLGLLVDQLSHAARGLWRSRIVLIFTFILPLVWLVLMGLVAGDQVADPATGVRTMQFVTPMAAVFGAVFATYPPVAMSLALAREQRILKRLQGTPTPVWIYLLGQVGAAMLLATAALLLMLAIGVAAYGVQIEWRSVPASVVTLVVGVACLASVGLAVGAVAPTAATAQAFTMASAVLMAFVSGLFRVGDTEPAWMAPVGALFPMRNIADPLRDQFDPAGTGGGWAPGALAVLAAWGIGSLLFAAWALRREPATASAPRRTNGLARGTPAAVASIVRMPVVAGGRPRALALMADQARWAIMGARRNVSIVFFAIVMPVGLYALICSMYPQDAPVHDMPLGIWFGAAMTAYGAGVIGFMHLTVSLAAARELGALKRLRGTPVPAWAFLAGRTIEVLALALVVAILILAVGTIAFGVRVSTGALPSAAAVLLLGTVTMATCGLALVALVPTARAASTLTMAILLPLSFVSDIFVVGNIPAPVQAFASLFPLKHVVAALAATLDPAGGSLAWTDLAVIAVWLVGASVVALRRFRWEPDPGAVRAPRIAQRRSSGGGAPA
ncbi:MAG TPA: ABC transporter permease [Candidatus Sulfotelmatobacter sp.]|nr:ABC transporter permease [Candidatus Sulfotelmatobacter sp.]